YIRKNSSFDRELGVEAWRKMLAKVGPIESLLECGCNIGRNMRFVDEVLPKARKAAIEISEAAYRFVISEFELDRSFNGRIVDAPFDLASLDLVFTMGVLIHIHPDYLLANMRKMFELSKRYI